MFARVSEITGPIDQLDRGIAGFRDQVVPAVRGMNGFVRAYLLVDRASGKTLAISVWETEEAMRASEEAAGRLRAAVTEGMDDTSAALGHFEVVLSEPAS
jgi:heme-degrading monooxygenase HmoA